MRYIVIAWLALSFAGCSSEGTGPSLFNSKSQESASKPIYLSDRDYSGVDVQIGVQDNEALPVQAILQAVEDLPVTLHMEPDTELPVTLQMQDTEHLTVQVGGLESQTLPVEVTSGGSAINVQISTDQDALPVAFGLPPLPPEAIAPAILAGVGLVLIFLFSFLAALGSYKAARRTENIAKLLSKQLAQKNRD
jgi:hypothetical protein